MTNTPIGLRIVEGLEGKLYLLGSLELIRKITEEPPEGIGALLFVPLGPKEKIKAVISAAEAITSDEVTELTPLAQAAAYSVYCNLMSGLYFCAPDNKWQRLASNTWLEVYADRSKVPSEFRATDQRVRGMISQNKFSEIALDDWVDLLTDFADRVVPVPQLGGHDDTLEKTLGLPRIGEI